MMRDVIEPSSGSEYNWDDPEKGPVIALGRMTGAEHTKGVVSRTPFFGGYWIYLS
jgi:hypothetical protein